MSTDIVVPEPRPSRRGARPAPTDFELALKHRYVTLHGREPAPGVTSVDIVEKPALKWASSRIGVLEGLAAGRDPDLSARLLAEARDALQSRPRTMIQRLEGKEKIPYRQASDEEVLVHWLRGAFDRQWKGTAVDGQNVHDLAEALSRGIDSEIPARLAGYADAWLRFHEECKPEWIALERILVDPAPRGSADLEYGGRTDFFAVLHDGPLPGLRVGDYKTGGHYRGPVGRQMALYAGAAGFAAYLDNGDLGPLDPIPDVDGAIAVYLRADGTYLPVDPWADVPREAFYEQGLSLRSAMNVERLIEALERAEKKESQ